MLGKISFGNETVGRSRLDRKSSQLYQVAVGSMAISVEIVSWLAHISLYFDRQYIWINYTKKNQNRSKHKMCTYNFVARCGYYIIGRKGVSRPSATQLGHCGLICTQNIKLHRLNTFRYLTESGRLGIVINRVLPG